jgi:hypothetical protein
MVRRGYPTCLLRHPLQDGRTAFIVCNHAIELFEFFRLAYRHAEVFDLEGTRVAQRPADDFGLALVGSKSIVQVDRRRQRVERI